MCDSVDAVRRRFKLSQRFTCLRHVCARANNFRVRRYLSEYIETEMAEVTNPGNAKEEMQVQSRHAMTFLSDHSS